MNCSQSFVLLLALANIKLIVQARKWGQIGLWSPSTKTKVILLSTRPTAGQVAHLASRFPIITIIAPPIFCVHNYFKADHRCGGGGGGGVGGGGGGGT